MEENLDKNNEVNKEISDNTTKSNSEEIKGPKSEKVINVFKEAGWKNLETFEAGDELIKIGN